MPEFLKWYVGKASLTQGRTAGDHGSHQIFRLKWTK